jgi:protein-tyrosine phosphatase
MPAEPPVKPSRVPMQTMYNVRDLGGYQTADGRMTAFRRFLRSDAPVRLNEADLEKLAGFPVCTVIDLRSPNEIGSLPHRLRDQPGVNYFIIPLLGDDLDAGMAAVEAFEEGRTIGLADLYIHTMEHSKESIGQVFRRMAEAKPGAILFHCSHGKDRTGLIAALLLLLAKVSDADIVENYRISYELLKPWFDTFIHEVPEQFLPFFNTDPENMELTLRYFHSHYLSAEAYLASCGVSKGNIERLKQRLLE